MKNARAEIDAWNIKNSWSFKNDFLTVITHYNRMSDILDLKKMTQRLKENFNVIYIYIPM